MGGGAHGDTQTQISSGVNVEVGRTRGQDDTGGHLGKAWRSTSLFIAVVACTWQDQHPSPWGGSLHTHVHGATTAPGASDLYAELGPDTMETTDRTKGKRALPSS